MGKLLVSCMAVQLLLLWSCGTAQVPAGFLSIDCGSPSATSYTDTNNIAWTSDADLMTEGEPLTVDSTSPRFLNTMRLFTGNQSKYCYTLSNSAVKPGDFFLVRASFWSGSPPPYTPKSSDGDFRFKLLIDADEWWDIRLANSSTTWLSQELYMRALRDSIDVCLARSAPDGDAPFISALELRPLPSSLSATRLIASTNRNFVYIHRDDVEILPGYTRYPLDSLDRIWLSNSATPVLTTTAAIDTSNDPDIPPVNVLQTSFVGNTSVITWTYFDMDVNGVFYCLFYFAEIDLRVNASGLRVFNIVLLNGMTQVNAMPIDVFAAVGADRSYEIITEAISADQLGQIVFQFSATSTSLYYPMLAATELYQASSKAFSNGSSSNDVIAIDDLKASMNLISYTGDPCLPIGFAYSWLTCAIDTTTTGVPSITSISLSNHLTGGKIPDTINTLTMLDQIFLDGNNLEGSIPNMGDLTNLHTLFLSNNRLSGSIPDSLATLNNLKVL